MFTKLLKPKNNKQRSRFCKQKLPENSGMLFVYPHKTRASFSDEKHIY